jgi:hypothetical protein
VQGVTVITLLISKVLNVNVAKEMEFLRISFGSLFQTRLDNISNPTMRTGLDFKSAEFDQAQGEAEDLIKIRGLEI